MRMILCGCLFLGAVLMAMSDSRADEKVELLQQARQAMQAEKSEQVVELLSQYLKLSPDDSGAWYQRGVHHFRILKFQESVSDFDRYVELNPSAERKLWERGISHYYAGMFREGAEQFALYQTYHDNDVENSVWRFLCMSKREGIEPARKEMLPIKNDPRIPLMEVYAMFRGESTPEKVLEVARAGNPADEILQGQLFYAQLYLAIYYDAMGDATKAEQYALQAWKDHEQTQNISRYMWQVARVHAEDLKAKREAAVKKP